MKVSGTTRKMITGSVISTELYVDQRMNAFGLAMTKIPIITTRTASVPSGRRAEFNSSFQPQLFATAGCGGALRGGGADGDTGRRSAVGTAIAGPAAAEPGAIGRGASPAACGVARGPGRRMRCVAGGATGGPVRRGVRLVLRPASVNLEADYNPAIVFSDGSAALFTGHFDLLPLSGLGQADALPADLSATALDIPPAVVQWPDAAGPVAGSWGGFGKRLGRPPISPVSRIRGALGG